MSTMSPWNRWSQCSPQIHSVLRMMAAFMFMLSGTTLLFGWPTLPQTGATAPVMSQMWIGGVLEAVGGTFLLLGLFTRPVAFLLSGEMAVAYFQFHYTKNPWPSANNGMAAVLFCFVWLFFSAAGGGTWSLDAWLRGRSSSR